MAPVLRPYQADLLGRLEAEIAAGRRRVLLVAPTGSGKTVIAAGHIRKIASDGQRVLVVDHRRELTEQASSKLHAVGIDHGIIQAGFPSRPGERVQIASVQTLHARALRARSMELPRADLVVIDEAHRVRARTYMRLVEAYPDAVVLGLTATPCRADGRGLGNVFQALIECPDVAQLTRDGYLVAAKIYAPVRPDLTGIWVERGDYVERQLAERVNTPKLVGDVVSHWHRLGEHRRTVVFATGVAHSVHLRDEFRRSGVLAEHIDGMTPTAERDAILARLAAGTVEVVCNAMVLTEGWDSPETSCLVLARPTKSLGLFRQMIGRVLRPAPSKVDAVVIDHASAVFMHGFPDDPIAWALEEDQRAENRAHSARGTHRASALTTCPECSAVRFEGKPCPVCHWQPKRKPVPIDVADGELGQVERDRTVIAPTFGGDEKLNFYRQLLYIARERGYQRGWVAHKFKEKFGDWPAWRYSEPMPPDDAVRAWIRSRQIAFKRAMEKQRSSSP